MSPIYIFSARHLSGTDKVSGKKEKKGEGRKGNITGKDLMKDHLSGFNIFISMGFDDLHSETLHEGYGVYKPTGKSTENLLGVKEVLGCSFFIRDFNTIL